MTDSGTWHLATNRSEFLDLQSDWERLFQQNSRHSPFLAWGWINAWLKHIAGRHELLIACLRDDSGALVFVLPLVRRTREQRFGSTQVEIVCSYGPECSEKLSCLCVPALEPRAVGLSATAISRYTGRHDTISLGRLDNAAGYASGLRVAMQESGRHSRLRPDVACPTVRLPESWDEYLGGLSSNFRSQVRRSYRQVDGDEMADFQSIPFADAEAFARDLIRLNRSRMQAKGETSSLEDEAFRDFLGEAIPYMAARELAWMDSIERGDEVLGSALNLVHGGSAYFYMGGFDDRASKLRPGTALFAQVIQRCIDGGYAEYDFLRGAEPYKYRWGAEDSITQRVVIYPRGFIRGRLAPVVDELYIAMREIVRRLRARTRRQ